MYHSLPGQGRSSCWLWFRPELPSLLLTLCHCVSLRALEVALEVLSTMELVHEVCAPMAAPCLLYYLVLQVQPNVEF
jgi:hypothetical protein